MLSKNYLSVCVCVYMAYTHLQSLQDNFEELLFIFYLIIFMSALCGQD